MDYAKKVLEGNVSAASKLMRAIEDGHPEASRELRQLYKHTGKAFTIGVTGAPGVGKSTLVDCLIAGFRQRQMTVGVVAIDPTSPFTGGALLGDRVRMGRHSTDKGVFIRSLASRGWTGGLSRATISMIRVLDAMGKEIILVEAVGSGQGEVSINRVADTTIVVLSPGQGDEIQMMKAGILETADIYVINKADKDGADNLKVQLETMLAMKPKSAVVWEPGIVLTQAVNGVGIDELVEITLKHRDFLHASGEIKRKSQARARLELTETIEHALRDHVNKILEEDDFKKLVDSLASKKADPYLLAERVLAQILKKPDSTK